MIFNADYMLYSPKEPLKIVMSEYPPSLAALLAPGQLSELQFVGFGYLVFEKIPHMILMGSPY